jgi:Uma2 family endonuclease
MTWDDDKRRELIDGVPYLMSAPSLRHQRLLGNLYGQFWTFLKGKKCKVFFAPLDVRLNADTFDNTVVQPDMLIICNESVIDKAGCKGVPDMVVEILSPSTSRYDRITKFNTYLKAGIHEYWIVDPETKTLAVHVLKDGNYIIHPYFGDVKVPVHVLEGFSVDLSEVFEE